MEAQALALMGRKMRAAQTLYGDEVGGAIVPVKKATSSPSWRVKFCAAQS
jgi:hypothetical protein